ncbi:MAG: tRNA-binding protein [Deltaproteobacteria bacterium]|jgi:tRNA-binding protein|nr:tRNA-binding protein [Deltaproteobacteria bacterium]
MAEITWDDFEKIQMLAGTVVKVEAFPEARKPAWKVWADFGPEIGELKSSAQITVHYRPEDLIGKQIVGVVNFPAKRIGPMLSQFLLTGFHDADGNIVLATPERPVPNGSKIC